MFVGADKNVCDDDRLVDRVDKIKGSGELRELPRTLYPNVNRRVCERVLTAKHSLTIHKTVYSIIVIDIIYQPEKIG